MATYRLTYFDITGLGEPIRYILNYGGVKFEDRRVSFDEWPKLKPETPMGQMPMLEIGDKTYHQSRSILRYLAKKFGLSGDDDEEAFEIDAAADSMDDLRLAIALWYWEPDAQIKEKKKDGAFKKLEFLLPRFEEQVKKNNGYFVRGKLSWADILWASYSDYLTNVLGHNPNKDYPELAKLVETIAQHPNIKPYLETRPKTMI